MRRTATVYGLVVSLTLLVMPATAQAASIDRACPPDRVQPTFFTDTLDNTHERSIDCVVWYDVAQGVSDRRYAPTRPVTRGQMATFIAGAVEATRQRLPAPADQGVPDVAGTTHEDAINQLLAADLVSGRGDGTYGPGGGVTRGQMATFLVAAYEYLSGESLSADEEHFNDTGGVHADNIDKAAGAGFTSGIGGGRYGPDREVPRDQMATFVARMLNRAVDHVPGSRANPLPQGHDVALHDDWELEVLSVTPDATDQVLDENPYNDPPADGNQYFIAELRATYRGDGSSRFDGSFRLRTVGDAGVTYSTFGDSCGVIPDDLPDPETFTGGSIAGNLCWEIRTEDADSLVLFDDDIDSYGMFRPHLALH